MRRWAAGAALMLAAAGLSGCGAIPTQADPSSSTTTEPVGDPPIQQAANNCKRGHLTRDDGMSITLDTKGKDEGFDEVHDTIDDIACMLSELDAPDYVAQHIDSTRALDGQQTDEWDGVEARWTYHPDSGLQITFIDRS